MKRILLLLSVFFIFNLFISGQKAPLKFGDVSLEELQMVSYPQDTSAPAIILFDYGILNTNSLMFTRTLRIKILKKEGYQWANNSYPVSSKSMIRGITSNLVDGKIVQEKLKNESIFSDRVTDNVYVTRTAMPNVKVGSVIDLQFTYTGIPDEWKFQEVIPVQYSELVMENTPNITFKYNYFGYERLAITSPTRWVGKNMPSFKIEPFMTSKENYLTKLEFDIREIRVGSYYQAVADSWESIVKLFNDNSNFGKALSSSGYLNTLAKSIEDSKLTGKEKLKFAFESVKSVVKWDEKVSVLASNTSLGYTFKMKVGNSADVNLILYQLLKKLNFNVNLVLMSTRENGMLSPYSPSRQKLNYVIVLAEVGDESVFLDATEPFMPYFLLPMRSLNYKGILINDTRGEPVDIAATRKGIENTSYTLKIQDNNTLKGKLSVKSIDYSAFDFRKKYHKFNSTDEYLDDYKKDKPGMIIDESKIINIDSIDLPVIEEYDITLANQLNVIGSEVYLIPMLYDRIKENPFKTDVRKYPIDYGYNIEKTTNLSFEIPDKYVVSALPASTNQTINGSSFIYNVKQVGNIITISKVFSINKPMFLPTEYKNLKEFYNTMIKKESEPIILKNK